MYKASWGQRRICPMCRAAYFDLGRTNLNCPSCGKEIEVANLSKPRRGRKPGSSKIQLNTVNSLNPKPKTVTEDELNIENVDSVNVETDNTEIEDDSVLINDENDIDPAIDAGIKPTEEKDNS